MPERHERNAGLLPGMSSNAVLAGTDNNAELPELDADTALSRTGNNGTATTIGNGPAATVDNTAAETIRYVARELPAASSKQPASPRPMAGKTTHSAKPNGRSRSSKATSCAR
jgi:hypothetical protein